MNATDTDALERRLLRHVQRASKQFRLFEPNDRIMVCLSGGKDSWAMLHLLRLMQTVVPFEMSLVAVNLDQGHPGFPAHVISDYLVEHGYEHRMVSKDTYAVVTEKIPEGKTYCSLCSRLRRGILYDVAVDLGCTKIALGHHRDDILHTALLNLFFGGKLATMPPKVYSDDGRNTVIRPLALCDEDDIATYAAAKQFPIVPCDLCGSQDNLQRQQMKALLNGLAAENPRIKGNMMAALGNVNVSHLLDLDLRARVGLPD
ncbi:MAG: tRNA 2-thiocytidine(32) synthetase TtcA [Myxococcales bacterium]|nr:tRNA 2-thiocytidine(32) synthetase TtcA [Myxococcales bacterium]MCB9532486.1 tRNA 2-thiocytidine(32) synthetase TtcA [Myxococcales bacterium]